MPGAHPPTPTTEAWTSRTGFLLATTGSAVGIGSIWKFPYEVGVNGGGAFVVVYALGLALVVVPLLLAEFAVGRRGGTDAATSIGLVASAVHASPRWRAVGILGALTSFLVLSFYAVIGGWTLYYAVRTAGWGLPDDAPGVQREFDQLLGSPWWMITFQALFLALLAGVVTRGVQRGIERAMKVLMPTLGVLLVALAIYSTVAGDAGAALRFLFVPDFGQLTGRAVLEALGLGFFSIGVGLGLMITYAGYASPDTPLRMVAVASVAADSTVSVLAGLAVFPVVFANNLDPASGPGLVFVSLPLSFTEMPLGRVAAVAFFVLLFVAAAGSAVSMLEGVVAVLGHRMGWSRRRAVAVATPTCLLAGLATVLSFNHWAEWHPLGGLDRFAGATVFDLIDEATSNLLLPLGGLALAIFTGWILGTRAVGESLGLRRSERVVLNVALRYVAPAAIVAATLGSFI
ncbi:MAG: sodium-dependent transporter [Acidimicrobiales bacterium]